jgi:hypothetical protein
VLILAAAAAGLKAEEPSPPPPAPAAEAKEQETNTKPGGNWFTRFWTDRVGKTIYNGLKTGARKVHHAFNGGSKEQDEKNARAAEGATQAPAPAEKPR